MLQESYTYAPETVYTDGVPVTTYPMATDTTYTTAAGTYSSTDALATPTTSICVHLLSRHIAGGNRRHHAARRFDLAKRLGRRAPDRRFLRPAGQSHLVEGRPGRITAQPCMTRLTGQLTESIQDVNTATASGMPTDPVLPGTATWATPSGRRGLTLDTDYQYDALGRVTQALGPAHLAVVNGAAQNVRTATWTVYQDAVCYGRPITHQTWTAQGYVPAAGGDGDDRGPRLHHHHRPGGPHADESRPPSPARPPGWRRPTPQPPSRSPTTSPGPRDQYSRQRLVSTRVYYSISSPSGAGTAAANYDETDYGYDSSGRLVWTKTPDGTITWNVCTFAAWSRARGWARMTAGQVRSLLGSLPGTIRPPRTAVR